MLADSGCVVASFLSVLFHVSVVSPSGLSWFLCVRVLFACCANVGLLDIVFVVLVCSACFFCRFPESTPRGRASNRLNYVSHNTP